MQMFHYFSSPTPVYYDDDEDVIQEEETEDAKAMDATFQRDPEFYVFHCLSIEETWNYLDSQVRDVGWELKVSPD